jgi:Cu-Zn family superoxide dismutase
MARTFTCILSIGLLLGANACSGTQTANKKQEQVVEAYVEIYPVRSTDIRGVIEFEVVDHGLLMTGHVKGLSFGSHGFGVLERGECLSPGGKAGNFYNPEESRGRAVGDLGNIIGDKSGTTKVHQVETRLSLKGPASIIGKTLGIHVWPNDHKTNPDEVPMAACGVIRAK